MKLQFIACILGLGVLVAACGSSPEGYVTGKDYEPAYVIEGYSGIEYTVECGLAIDGSFDCGKLKPKYVTRPDRHVPEKFILRTTDGTVDVSRGTWDACEVEDWYQDGRCYDERPAEDDGSQPAR